MTSFTFDNYDEEATKTDLGHPLWYYALALNGEAGEVAEKIKKMYRDHKGVLTEDIKMSVAKELGDVMWYLSRLSNQIGLSSEVIAKMNEIKLRERLRTNTLQGSGDNREILKTNNEEESIEG